MALDSPKVRVLVRLQVGIMLRPAGVTDGTAVFETARRGSIPRRGALGPRGVADGTRPCEGRGSGSTPDEDTRRWSQTARQPAATRSKWVRFPPASLTANCRFGLH